MVMTHVGMTTGGTWLDGDAVTDVETERERDIWTDGGNNTSSFVT